MGPGLLLLLLLTQTPTDWAQPFTQPAPLSAPPMPVQDARARYESATALITSRQYAQAILVLNELAQSAPSAEVFAARCSALHGLRNFAAALADCQYALRLKPAASIPSALYGQALAEENLGAAPAATQHYRDYANLPSAGVTPQLRNEALRRAAALTPTPTPAPVIVTTPPPARARATFNVGAGVVANSCRSSLDCGMNGWCKDRGDGIKVCMDNGAHGESCSNSIDCAGGGFCKDRGDGFKVCMDNGRRGDPCSSSIDCGSGLFCRGSGIKHCE